MKAYEYTINFQAIELSHVHKNDVASSKIIIYSKRGLSKQQLTQIYLNQDTLQTQNNIYHVPLAYSFNFTEKLLEKDGSLVDFDFKLLFYLQQNKNTLLIGKASFNLAYYANVEQIQEKKILQDTNDKQAAIFFIIKAKFIENIKEVNIYSHQVLRFSHDQNLIREVNYNKKRKKKAKVLKQLNLLIINLWQRVKCRIKKLNLLGGARLQKQWIKKRKLEDKILLITQHLKKQEELLRKKLIKKGFQLQSNILDSIEKVSTPETDSQELNLAQKLSNLNEKFSQKNSQNNTNFAQIEQILTKEEENIQNQLIKIDQRIELLKQDHMQTSATQNPQIIQLQKIIQLHVNEKIILKEQIDFLKEDLNKNIKQAQHLQQDNEKFRTICRELSENNKKQQLQIASLSQQLVQPNDCERQTNYNKENDHLNDGQSQTQYQLLIENSKLRKINEELQLTIERSKRIQSIYPSEIQQIKQPEQKRLRSNKPEIERLDGEEVQRIIGIKNNSNDIIKELQNEVNTLQTKNEELQQQIEKLLTQNTQYTELNTFNRKQIESITFNQYQEEISRLKTINQQQMEQLEILNKLQSNQQLELNQERFEKSELKKINEELKLKNKEFLYQTDNSKKSNGENQKNNQNEFFNLDKVKDELPMQIPNSESDASFTNFPDVVNKDQEELQKLKNVNNELHIQIQQLHQQITELRSNFRNIQSQNSQESQKNDIGQIQKLQKINAELSQKINLQQTELQKPKSINSQTDQQKLQEEEMQNLKKINENLLRNIENEVQLRKDSQNQIKQLNEQINQLQLCINLFETQQQGKNKESRQPSKNQQQNSLSQVQFEQNEELKQLKIINNELKLQLEQQNLLLNLNLKQNQNDLINKYLDEIRILKKTNGELLLEIENHNSFERKTVEIDQFKNLQEEMNKLMQECKLKSEQLKNTQNELDQVKKTNQSLHLQIEKQNLEIRIQSTKSDGRNQENFLYQTQQIFQQQKNEFDMIIETLNVELNQKKEAYEKLQIEHENLKNQFQQLQNQLESKDRHVQRYSIDMNQNQKMLESLRNAQSQQNSELSQYQAKLLQAENKNIILISQIEQLRKILAESQQSLSQQGQKNQKDNSHFNLENAQLQVQIKSLEQELELLLNSHNQIFSDYQNTQKEKEQLEWDLLEAKTRLGEFMNLVLEKGGYELNDIMTKKLD